MIENIKSFSSDNTIMIWIISITMPIRFVCVAEVNLYHSPIFINFFCYKMRIETDQLPIKSKFHELNHYCYSVDGPVLPSVQTDKEYIFWDSCISFKLQCWIKQVWCCYFWWSHWYKVSWRVRTINKIDNLFLSTTFSWHNIYCIHFSETSLSITNPGRMWFSYSKQNMLYNLFWRNSFEERASPVSIMGLCHTTPLIQSISFANSISSANHALQISSKVNNSY